MSANTCPVCGVLVLRSHHCRGSVLDGVAKAADQLALIEPLNDTTPRRRRRRMTNECPDHPGSGQRSWDCALCASEAVPGQAALIEPGDPS